MCLPSFIHFDRDSSKDFTNRVDDISEVSDEGDFEESPVASLKKPI